jgi:hypothetical protein
MLRMSQSDGGGDAMVAAPVGASLAMWTMNGNFRDVSGTANDGDPFPVAPNDPSYVAGGPGRGQAMSFDGDDEAWIPHHATYDALSFTVDAWIRTSDATAVVAARQDSSCGGPGLCQWELFINGGKLYAEIEVGGTWHGPISSTSVDDGTWHHVAMTVDDVTKEVRVYIDGVLEAVDTTWNAGSTDTGTIPVVLGKAGDHIHHYTGDLDELRFQPGVQTVSDIRRLATGRVADYANTINDWDTPIASTTMFGVCLERVANDAATDLSTFVPLAGCPTTDGTGWRALAPTSADPMSKVATAPITDQDATAHLRFGFRPSSSQPSGAYEAPVAFEVIAPAA